VIIDCVKGELSMSGRMTVPPMQRRSWLGPPTAVGARRRAAKPWPCRGAKLERARSDSSRRLHTMWSVTHWKPPSHRCAWQMSPSPSL